ncbi:lens fiber membrane intrinsic protein isoform X2 [Choloepus didactylus]|uniref:lens fiber membrane intrinsic protein isoform X2 n=1 Tax=Choloepus didactylus TaxID=27675 RepID=UPI0018A09ECF|nr:lens fiber membrane intrinsic protein isoform X2 [Choloepus didactylus]
MYSFLGGGLFCAWVGTILLVVATATDQWMQYRLSGSFAHQGLWRYCLGSKCYLQTESIAYWNATRAFMILSSLCATAGIVLGILAFVRQPPSTRLSRPFSAGILFFASTVTTIRHQNFSITPNGSLPIKPQLAFPRPHPAPGNLHSTS